VIVAPMDATKCDMEHMDLLGPSIRSGGLTQ